MNTQKKPVFATFRLTFTDVAMLGTSLTWHSATVKQFKANHSKAECFAPMLPLLPQVIC